MKFEDIKKGQAVIYRGQEYIVVFLYTFITGISLALLLLVLNIY